MALRLIILIINKMGFLGLRIEILQHNKEKEMRLSQNWEGIRNVYLSLYRPRDEKLGK